MRSIVNSFLICFSMYSVIPLPRLEWEEKRMKYIFIFFPLIGLFIGGVSLLWYKIALHYDLGVLIYACGASVIPILLTGGIHLDGFMDTSDAAASRSDWVTKSRIMKDPHTGAFAVMGCVVYFLATAGAYGEFFAKNGSLAMLVAVFVISRSLSGLVSVNLKISPASTMLNAFSGKADRRMVNAFLGAYLTVVFVVLYFFVPLTVLLILVAFCVIYTLWFRRFSYVGFGGMSGDLAGFYLVVCEVALTALAAFGARL